MKEYSPRECSTCGIEFEEFYSDRCLRCIDRDALKMDNFYNEVPCLAIKGLRVECLYPKGHNHERKPVGEPFGRSYNIWLDKIQSLSKEEIIDKYYIKL